MSDRIIDTEPTVRRRGRLIGFEWPLADGVDHYDDPCHRFAVLTAMSGHPERKRYSASILVETARLDSPGIRRSSPFDAISVLSEAAPRYSLSGAEAFAQRALAALRERKDDNAIRAIFDEPTAREDFLAGHVTIIGVTVPTRAAS